MATSMNWAKIAFVTLLSASQVLKLAPNQWWSVRNQVLPFIHISLVPFTNVQNSTVQMEIQVSFEEDNRCTSNCVTWTWDMANQKWVWTLNK
jgi:hypothetical protein